MKYLSLRCQQSRNNSRVTISRATRKFIMDLLLEIISHQRHAMSEKQSQFVFKAAGGTIGRNSKNDWLIDDPERLISGQHVSVYFENNHFLIIDTSTNGLFINKDQYALGDKTHIIRNGDVFQLGQYSIQATLLATQSAAVFSTSTPEEMNQHIDPLSQFSEVSTPGRFAGNDILSERDPINSVLAPIPSTQSYFDLPNAIPENWLDKTTQKTIEENNEFPSSVMSNEVKIEEELNQVGNFEDFKKDFESSNKRTKNAASIVKNKIKVKTKVQARKTYPHEQVREKKKHLKSSTKHTPGQHLEAISALLITMGLDPNDISDEQLPEVMENIAHIAKNSMSGLMKTMISRAHLKNEFRLSMTTIQSQENNPLKFCINYEQLVHYMLVNPLSGYLNSEQAIKESFEELQEHQIGVMAGMKSALNALLDKFSPEKITDNVNKLKTLGLGSKKSRYWDSFTDLYDEIKEEDDAFTALFSCEFSKAYERQIDDVRQAKLKVNT